MATVKQILSQAFSACCSCDTSCPLKVFPPPTTQSRVFSRGGTGSLVVQPNLWKDTSITWNIKWASFYRHVIHCTKVAFTLVYTGVLETAFVRSFKSSENAQRPFCTLRQPRITCLLSEEKLHNIFLTHARLQAPALSSGELLYFWVITHLMLVLAV